MKIQSTFLAIFFAGCCCFTHSASGDNEKTFSTIEGREEFASDVSGMIEKAWRAWQDAVVINDVYVDGSRGVLRSESMRGPALTADGILDNFDRTGKSAAYVASVHAVADALENGMRSWQRGYSNDSISFPQGASCVYSLTPCYNIPAAVDAGHSGGDGAMSEEKLYSYMSYRVPYDDANILTVFRSAARAISECFAEWKKDCIIKEIRAEGGMAPSPSPMGQGPGEVRGAKGNNGRLRGAYFNGKMMDEKMRAYLKAVL